MDKPMTLKSISKRLNSEAFDLINVKAFAKMPDDSLRPITAVTLSDGKDQVHFHLGDADEPGETMVFGR